MKEKKKLTNNNFVPLCLCASLFFLCVNLHAQTPAQEIETLLASPAITYAQAARFALQASDKLTTSDNNEAFRYAVNNGWLPKDAQADGQARLDAVSKFLLNCFDIKGGLIYRIGKSNHHAYREMQYQKIVHGRTYPNQKVSGDLFLFMVNRILAEREKAPVDEATQRREELAAEITAILVEHEVENTTVEATSQGVMITLSNIQFIADSAQLIEAERNKLREIASILKNLPEIKLLVSGHTALAGDETGRTRISQERAQAVANYLVAFGACSASNITAIGMGADKPIASNDTEEGRALNRRVEIMILE